MRLQLLLLICLQTLYSHAQVNTYRFKSWNTTHGLNANTCLSILEHPQGYMLIGTINGINRFTGTAFHNESPGTATQPITEVRDMVYDSDSVLWLACPAYGLVSVTTPESADQPSAIGYYAPEERGAPLTNATRLIDDGLGYIWVGIEARGLFRFDKKKKSFEKWPVNHPFSKFAESIRCFYKDERGRIWIGIVNGLMIVDPRTGKTEYPKPVCKQVSYLNAPTFRKFCYYNKDTLAVATDRGAHLYIQSRHEYIPVFDVKDSARMKHNAYNDVIRFSDKELWFASSNRGLMMVNPRTHEWRYATDQDSTGEGVPAVGVYRLLQDRHGNIWAAHQKGISFFSSRNHSFQNRPFRAYLSIPQVMEPITTGEKGDLYFSTSNDIFKQQRGDIAHPLDINKKYPAARFVKYYPGKGIFIQNPNGFYLYDEKRQTVSMLPLDTSSIVNNDRPLLVSPIHDMIADTFDNEEVAWITGLVSGSLFRYHWRTGKLISYDCTIKSDTLRKNYYAVFTCMEKDPNGGLWLGSQQYGVFYIPDLHKDHGISFSKLSGNKNFIRGDLVSDMYLDKQQHLWASIKDIGLININWQKPSPISYELYGKEYGLTNLALKRIQPGNANHLWISSAAGLFCFDPDKKWFRHFGQSHGIRNEVFNMACTRDASGNLYFAADDNLLYFDPAVVLQTKDSARLLIRQLTTSDRSIRYQSQEEWRLRPGENSFTIDVDLVDFENPRGQTLLYKLDGYDRDWQQLRDNYQLRYTNIPGGDYRLLIRMAGDQQKNSDELFVAIHIARYFYQQTWFIIAVSALALLAILMAARSYTRSRLKKQQQQFEQKRALEAERLRISSELHDDLGGGLSTIRLMTEMLRLPGMEDKQTHYLGHISEKSQELVHSMNEIVWSLNHHNDNFAGLIAYIRQFSTKYLEEAGINLNFSAPAALPDHEVKGHVRRNIFLLVKEALHNVVKHAGASEVKIEVHTGDSILIRITDNGKGFDRVKGVAGGNGLRTMQERADAVGGSLRISDVEGTCVELEIPEWV
ncbi:MAG: hypothetical protein J7527_08935 [Chitinophagaceae bacterium]|nr:hypothetical protein [Chitinophagaceae bacterium]